MKICSYHIPSVDSTNSWAKRHIDDFDPNALAIITADEQTQGRGRRGNVWLSPAKKNIILSLVVSIPEHVPVFCISQLVVIVLQDFLKNLGVDAKIKWPNDLLVSEKKISGILIEKSGTFYIIGIGLNVNMTHTELEKIPQRATSLHAEAHTEFDVTKLVGELVEDFVTQYKVALDDNFEHVRKSWQEKVQWMLKRTVSVNTNNESFEGKIQKVAADGTVFVTKACGKTVTVCSGEIFDSFLGIHKQPEKLVFGNYFNC